VFITIYVLIGLAFWVFSLIQAQRDGTINLRQPEFYDVFLSSLGLLFCVIGWAFVAILGAIYAIVYGLLRLVDAATSNQGQ